MPIKMILVPLDGSAESAQVLCTAQVVAERFDAHIKAIHVIPQAETPFMFDRLSAKLKQQVMEESEKSSLSAAETVREQFEALCAENGIKVVDKPVIEKGATASWHLERGNAGDVLVSHGRLVDVVTVSRPTLHEGRLRRGRLGETLEAMLMNTGRPVLIVPPKWQCHRVEHAAIGWNESLEASRALSMTIPWLSQMKTITVLASKKREASTARLIEYLSLQGCEARAEHIDQHDGSVGESMLKICNSVGAEFLVVGGFSHARSRQRLFGGVTQHLLANSNIITVMVH